MGLEDLSPQAGPLFPVLAGGPRDSRERTYVTSRTNSWHVLLSRSVPSSTAGARYLSRGVGEGMAMAMAMAMADVSVGERMSSYGALCNYLGM